MSKTLSWRTIDQQAINPQAVYVDINKEFSGVQIVSVTNNELHGYRIWFTYEEVNEKSIP